MVTDSCVRIQALKYGNRPHYEWETTLLERTDAHVFVLGQYGRKLRHYTKGKTFTVENWTIEFFPFDCWFTVSADIVDGRIAQYYCNICQPARMENDTVSFVDLDLDLVYRDGRWAVVDEDEFALHAVQFSYPPELIERAELELESLRERVRQQRFPFDGAIERWIGSIPAGRLAQRRGQGLL
jgi:protein associated with RNAse G/E